MLRIPIVVGLPCSRRWRCGRNFLGSLRNTSTHENVAATLVHLLRILRSTATSSTDFPGLSTSSFPPPVSNAPVPELSELAHGMWRFVCVEFSLLFLSDHWSHPPLRGCACAHVKSSSLLYNCSKSSCSTTASGRRKPHDFTTPSATPKVWNVARCSWTDDTNNGDNPRTDVSNTSENDITSLLSF